jgi:glycosyltransferase involved in cell wall biosynthesis
MKMSVLIPTYRRSQNLKHCLEAIKEQSQLPDEILLVVRDTDKETQNFLQSFNTVSLPIKVIYVFGPGQVSALNAGINMSTGDILAITDDDAAPHKDWLEKIKNHFLNDPKIGGVGGRDWIYINGKLIDSTCSPGASNIVGLISWFGRAVGNHHLGEGFVREVSILKGVNMSYRREAIRGVKFDERLLGSGAQFCNDMAFSLSIKRLGWKLIYDPAISVDHFPGDRFDEDQRDEFNFEACKNLAFNETLTVLDNLKGQYIIYAVWAVLIGTRACFGLIQAIRFLPQYQMISIWKLKASLQGRWQAYQLWHQSQDTQTKESSVDIF